MFENTRVSPGLERALFANHTSPGVVQSALLSEAGGTEARNGACAACPASDAHVAELAGFRAPTTPPGLGLSYVPKVSAHAPRFPSRQEISGVASELLRDFGASHQEVFSGQRDYVLSLSAGTIQLKSTNLALADFKEDTRALGELQSGGEADSVLRGDIKGWSRKSRANMVRVLSQLDYQPLISHPASQPAMVTLTLPGCHPEAVAESSQQGKVHICDNRCYWVDLCPTASDFKRKIKTLMERWQRLYGVKYQREYERLNKRTGVIKKSTRKAELPIPAVFKLEFQRRTAPHVHILAPVPRGSELVFFRQWLSKNWAEIVTGEKEKKLDSDPEPSHIYWMHKRAGTGVDLAEGARAQDPRRLAVYFSKHAAPGKTSKEYQHTSVPQHWEKVGRFWWYSGLEKYTEEVVIEAEDYLHLRRLIARSSSYYSTVPVKDSAGRATDEVKQVRRHATRAYGNRVRGDASIVCAYPGLFRTYNDAPRQLRTLMRAVKIIRAPLCDPLDVPLDRRLEVFKKNKFLN